MRPLTRPICLQSLCPGSSIAITAIEMRTMMIWHMAQMRPLLPHGDAMLPLKMLHIRREATVILPRQHRIREVQLRRTTTLRPRSRTISSPHKPAAIMSSQLEYTPSQVAIRTRISRPPSSPQRKDSTAGTTRPPNPLDSLYTMWANLLWPLLALPDSVHERIVCRSVVTDLICPLWEAQPASPLPVRCSKHTTAPTSQYHPCRSPCVPTMT